MRVGDFVTGRALLAPDITGELVERWFHENPGFDTVPVVHPDGTIVGAVNRQRFLYMLSGRFGHALYGQRPIAEIMEREFLLVPAECDLQSVGEYLSTRANVNFYDDVIVDLQPGYGIAPARAILEALHRLSDQMRRDLAMFQSENRRLQVQAEARWEMISSLSHELRTPLATIVGYAELAEMVLDSDPARARAHLAKLRSGADELFGHIQSVLDMARAAAGRLELDLERFDFRSEIQSAVELAGILTRERPIQIGHLQPPDPVWVWMDRRKVRQVLVNLVGNAAKFTSSGSIRIALMREGREVAVSVADTGPGIPEDKLKGLFERFERVGDRSIEGSGLGLSIVKALVEAQGGRVSVRSTVGQGSEFSVYYSVTDQAS